MTLGFQSKLEFEKGFFFLRREENPEDPEEKTLGVRTRTNNKLNSLMTPGPGIEPGPHWWEASAPNTAPYLLAMQVL